MNIINHEFLKPTKAASHTVSANASTVIDTHGSFAVVKITSGSVYASGLDTEPTETTGFLLDTDDTLCISHGIKLIAKTGKDSTAATAAVLFLESN